MDTPTTDHPVTQPELRLAISELRIEMGQMEIRLIDRIHKLERFMLAQTVVLLGAILAAAKYIH